MFHSITRLIRIFASATAGASAWPVDTCWLPLGYYKLTKLTPPSVWSALNGPEFDSSGTLLRLGRCESSFQLWYGPNKQTLLHLKTWVLICLQVNRGAACLQREMQMHFVVNKPAEGDGFPFSVLASRWVGFSSSLCLFPSSLCFRQYRLNRAAVGPHQKCSVKVNQTKWRYEILRHSPPNRTQSPGLSWCASGLRHMKIEMAVKPLGERSQSCIVRQGMSEASFVVWCCCSLTYFTPLKPFVFFIQNLYIAVLRRVSLIIKL